MANTNDKNSSELPQFKCLHCGKIPQIPLKEIQCPYCLGLIGMITEPNPETQCGNCHEGLLPEDQYCRFCGTKRGEGAYEPYYEMLGIPVVYGPKPVERVHTCEQCGYRWETCLMTDHERYCPKCGGEAPGHEKYYNEKYYNYLL